MYIHSSSIAIVYYLHLICVFVCEREILVFPSIIDGSFKHWQGFHPENFCWWGKLHTEKFFGGEAACIHHSQLKWPAVDIWEGSWRFWGGSFPPLSTGWNLDCQNFSFSELQETTGISPHSILQGLMMHRKHSQERLVASHASFLSQQRSALYKKPVAINVSPSVASVG